MRKQQVFLRTPSITDDIERWLPPRVIHALHAHGIKTLAELTLSTPRSEQWWTAIPTLGQTSAQQIKANNDNDAVQTWRSLHELPSTKRSYRKEAERLILWAIVERGRALSPLTMSTQLPTARSCAGRRPASVNGGQKATPNGGVDQKR